MRIFPFQPSSSPKEAPIISQSHLNVAGAMSVRSVAFHTTMPDLLAFSTLSSGDVSLVKISPDHQSVSPLLLLKSFNTTVTVLRWFPDSMILAIGMTNGEVSVFYLSEDLEIKRILNFLAHKSSKPSDDFGSLDIQAEVWSLDWRAKDSSQLATVSEDQSMKIWKIEGDSATEIMKV